MEGTEQKEQPVADAPYGLSTMLEVLHSPDDLVKTKKNFQTRWPE